MTLRNSAIPAIAILVAAVAFSVARPAASQNAPSGKIAFVDVARVFKEYKKAGDVNQMTRTEIQKLEAELRGRFEELKKLRDDLDLLVAGTPEYTQKKQTVDFESFRLEYEEKTRKQAIMDGAMKRLNLVYREIRTEAENYALRNGLEAVLMFNDQEVEARSPEELMVIIASRPVLFREKARDITDSILQILNS